LNVLGSAGKTRSQSIRADGEHPRHHPALPADPRLLGIDLVLFGVVAIVNCMIGLITPPYGILLFVINAVTGISLRAIISEIWPFLGVLILALLVMILSPDLVLWLPRRLGYLG
jgi:TRAP-type transport system large permease protein